MLPVTLANYIQQRLWLHVTCRACGHQVFLDPRDLANKLRRETYRRPAEIRFRCFCGVVATKSVAPVCMLIPSVTMGQVEALRLLLKVRCTHCRREAFQGGHEWRAAGRPMDRPIASLRFRCIKCRRADGEPAVWRADPPLNLPVLWRQDFGPPGGPMLDRLLGLDEPHSGNTYVVDRLA